LRAATLHHGAEACSEEKNVLTLNHSPRTRFMRAPWMLEETGNRYTLVIEPALAARRQGYHYDPSSVARDAFDEVLEPLQEGAAAAAAYLLGEGFTAADIPTRDGMHYGIDVRRQGLECHAAAVTGRTAYQRALTKDAAMASRIARGGA
jgi:hypothetical protein